MSPTDAETHAHEALQSYTLTHGGPGFLHQHVVDAWAAQHARADDKPIGITFALVGLYLHVECGLSGREVQRVHMALARHRQTWPSFELPADRGDMTTIDVMAAPEGRPRDAAIRAWARSVWGAYRPQRPVVTGLLARHQLLPASGE